MIKLMKNVSKFLTELVFTVIVAGVLSVLFALGVWFVLANLNVTEASRSYVDFVSGILFGLIVGFKLKALLSDHAPVTKKKK